MKKQLTHLWKFAESEYKMPSWVKIMSSEVLAHLSSKNGLVCIQCFIQEVLAILMFFEALLKVCWTVRRWERRQQTWDGLLYLQEPDFWSAKYRYSDSEDRWLCEILMWCSTISKSLWLSNWQVLIKRPCNGLCKISEQNRVLYAYAIVYLSTPIVEMIFVFMFNLFHLSKN